MKFDHLGLVVENLELGRVSLEQMLPIRAWTNEFVDPRNGVRCQFGQDADGFLFELLEPLGRDSPIARALKKGQAILNHIAYLVPDLAAGRDHLRAARCLPTGNPQPAVAYGGRPIQFFFAPLGFLIELIEAQEHRHQLLDTGVGSAKP
jgi:methylmalonyl-CoA/ethylmalonyl-CoA epimerase